MPRLITHAKTQRKLMLALSVLALLTWASSFVGIAYRLGSMNLDGLGAVGLALVALGFGYTSLLFNRARALDEGRLRRRTMASAEVAFRGTVILVLVFCLTAAVFGSLLALGFEPRAVQWKSNNLTAGLEIVPLLAAINAVGLAQVAGIAFFHSIRLLLRRGFAWGIETEIYRRRAR